MVTRRVITGGWLEVDGYRVESNMEDGYRVDGYKRIVLG